jgi:hypothetical protein
MKSSLIGFQFPNFNYYLREDNLCSVGIVSKKTSSKFVKCSKLSILLYLYKIIFYCLISLTYCNKNAKGQDVRNHLYYTKPEIKN